MTIHNDETLGAYIDGELDGDTLSTLEADIRADPALRKRVAELHAVTTAVRKWSEAQIPSRAYGWPSDAGNDNQRSHHRPTRKGWAPSWSHVIAAGVALLFGVGIGQFVSIAPRQNAAASEAAVRQLLQAAMEHTLSGQAVTWSDATSQRTVTVQPLRTYKASDTFCREYRETMTGATQSSERTMYGLACRDPEGIWNVRYTLAPGA